MSPAMKKLFWLCLAISCCTVASDDSRSDKTDYQHSTTNWWDSSSTNYPTTTWRPYTSSPWYTDSSQSTYYPPSTTWRPQSSTWYPASSTTWRPYSTTSSYYTTQRYGCSFVDLYFSAGGPFAQGKLYCTDQKNMKNLKQNLKIKSEKDKTLKSIVGNKFAKKFMNDGLRNAIMQKSFEEDINTKKFEKDYESRIDPWQSCIYLSSHLGEGVGVEMYCDGWNWHVHLDLS